MDTEFQTQNKETMSSIAQISEVMDEYIASATDIKDVKTALMVLDETASIFADKAKKLRKKIAADHADAIAAAYAAKGDIFGTANVEVDGMVLKCTTPKTVKWDSKLLEEMCAKITASGDDPKEYVKIDYSIEEKKFSAWSKSQQEFFIDARTVKAGTMKIEIKPLNEEE